MSIDMKNDLKKVKKCLFIHF